MFEPVVVDLARNSGSNTLVAVEGPVVSSSFSSCRSSCGRAVGCRRRRRAASLTFCVCFVALLPALLQLQWCSHERLCRWEVFILLERQMMALRPVAHAANDGSVYFAFVCRGCHVVDMCVCMYCVVCVYVLARAYL